MPELTSAPEQPDHLKECPSCVARLERQRGLAAGLKRVAGSLDSREASPAVETRLIQAFRAHAASQPVFPRPHWLGWAVAAVLVMGALSLTVGWRFLHPQQNSASLEDTAEQSIGESTAGPEFIPLPYGFADPSASATVEDADLVRVEVPRSALLALGVPVAEGASARVEAVMALGPDGMLQGIQIIQ